MFSTPAILQGYSPDGYVRHICEIVLDPCNSAGLQSIAAKTDNPEKVLDPCNSAGLQSAYTLAEFVACSFSTPAILQGYSPGGIALLGVVGFSTPAILQGYSPVLEGSVLDMMFSTPAILQGYSP